jgi:transcriptional regulator with XRE-family HTH domain
MEEQRLKAILGKNVKLFRLQRRLSQAGLAEKVNISITFLSNIERGNTFPKAGTLCNLAKGLEVEVWELFKGELTPDESKTAAERFENDVRQRINRTLDDIFGHCRADETG